jgi:nucleotide-binding universal stress UspA family protein
MFHKILVAIDLSATSQQVFQQALSLAQTNQAKLILLHVLSSKEADSLIMSSYFAKPIDHCIHLDPRIIAQANQVYKKEWELFKQKGLELLRDFAKIAIASGVKIETSQITGHPSSTICDFAQSCKAEIIVIGKQEYSDLQELFLGSTSSYVVHHAPCSVLLVLTSNFQKQPVLLPNSQSIETKACTSVQPTHQKLKVNS